MNIPDGLYDIEPAKSNDSDIAWKLIYDTDPDLFPFIPRDAYYVQSLATRAEIRGQGVGHKLLNTAFKRAKEKSLKSCQLDVVSDSVAVNFYRKMGMEVLAVTRMPYLELKKNTGYQHTIG
jgi:ribosomal protein S18 acetylase RimI-like enzyme